MPITKQQQDYYAALIFFYIFHISQLKISKDSTHTKPLFPLNT